MQAINDSPGQMDGFVPNMGGFWRILEKALSVDMVACIFTFRSKHRDNNTKKRSHDARDGKYPTHKCAVKMELKKRKHKFKNNFHAKNIMHVITTSHMWHLPWIARSFFLQSTRIAYQPYHSAQVQCYLPPKRRHTTQDWLSSQPHTSPDHKNHSGMWQDRVTLKQTNVYYLTPTGEIKGLRHSTVPLLCNEWHHFWRILERLWYCIRCLPKTQLKGGHPLRAATSLAFQSSLPSELCKICAKLLQGRPTVSHPQKLASLSVACCFSKQDLMSFSWTQTLFRLSWPFCEP